MTDYRDIPNSNDTVKNRRGYVADTPSGGGNLVWVIIGAAVIAFGALFFLSSGTGTVDPNSTTGSISAPAPTDGAGTLAVPDDTGADTAPMTGSAPAAPEQ
ncbi:hypothetical protein DFR52_1011071 [Hoeflea marina]|uniref:Uncharacterized protein n=1 Tax=Hoeflea marina TaxID=274592 RepID=A0A317PSD5_9HYPH|nr:hypothetical protein [Hoeflea marina]PWW04373.1 hypothetical protein DFR52_1011071 [Hoeflea marina]